VLSCYALFAPADDGPDGRLDLPPRYAPVVTRAIPDDAGGLVELVETLRPLQRPLPEPGPNDWLAVHKEAGQTFAEYLDCDPVTVRGTRRVIYVQPLGRFNETRFRIVKLTAEFMSIYFGLPVTVRKPGTLANLPRRARRVHPSWGVSQILTTYVLDHILKPRLPADAAAYIAFTTSDLWPGTGWNFVFGQASLYERVGVWSLHRQGDPEQSEEAFKLCLLRTLKIATHETGHMFSMQHCIRYACNMCGSNNREESDRNPLHLCCECVAKLSWATGVDPRRRYGELAEYCERNGLRRDGLTYSSFAAALETNTIPREGGKPAAEAAAAGK
jgi:archaemetzincin